MDILLEVGAVMNMSGAFELAVSSAVLWMYWALLAVGLVLVVLGYWRGNGQARGPGRPRYKTDQMGWKISADCLGLGVPLNNTGRIRSYLTRTHPFSPS